MVPTSLRDSISLYFKAEKRITKLFPLLFHTYPSLSNTTIVHRQASLLQCPPAALIPLAPYIASVSLFTHPSFFAFSAAPANMLFIFVQVCPCSCLWIMLVLLTLCPSQGTQQLAGSLFFDNILQRHSMSISAITQVPHHLSQEKQTELSALLSKVSREQ